MNTIWTPKSTFIVIYYHNIPHLLMRYFDSAIKYA